MGGFFDTAYLFLGFSKSTVISFTFSTLYLQFKQLSHIVSTFAFIGFHIITEFPVSITVNG
jgi:hypothetical protein